MAQQTKILIDNSKTITAVDWLIIWLDNNNYHISSEIAQAFKQAKAMEKEQIVKAVDSNFNYDNNGYPTLGEQYYNETYNK